VLKEPTSRALKTRANDLRKIAARSKSKVGRNLATRMAEEKDQQAAAARAQDKTRTVTEH
jgi:ribosomal protein L18E